MMETIHPTQRDFSQAERETIARIANNWRLTPATMAVKLSKGAWLPAPWLMYVSKIVAQAVKQGGGRIIISAPPRHGKSELISVYTPVWVLETTHNKNVMLTSYGAELSEQYGRRVRDTILDNQDLLDVSVPRSTSKVHAFLTTHNGYMYSVGLGGSITGRGAHVLLIDDYIKEIKEALSPAYRAYVWNWFVTTAMTRLEPGATVIIIATRWHSDDLIGRIVANFPGRWQNIVLPAFSEGEDVDPLRRPKGEPLFPQRYDVPYLNSQMEVMGSAFWNALYMQRPVDEAHKLANGAWLKTVMHIRDFGVEINDWKFARVWDLAATEGGGDFTAGTHLGYSKQLDRTIITNVIRDQLSPGQVESKVREIAMADGLDTKIFIEQEPGSSGKTLVEHYKNVVLPEFEVDAVPATKSKLIRAQPLLAAAEAGQVYLLDGEWNAAFRQEFDSFPAGMNDDQVDTAAAGYAKLAGKKVFSLTWGRQKPVDDKSSTKALRRASLTLGAPRATYSKITFGRRA
jgi:predicted phage terminase large subunit-like protein